MGSLIGPPRSCFEQNGWRLYIAEGFPSAQETVRAILELDSGAREPFRRSRHARTYLLSSGLGNEHSDLFVKYYDPPAAWRRLKSCWRQPITFRTARITLALRAAGFSAPAVLFYGTSGHHRRELIVTRRAEGDGPVLALRRLAGSITAKRIILRALGKEIGRLHRAGFIHGDLTPFNIRIVIDDPPRFTFIDNDRTRRRPVTGWQRHRLRNLVQLGRFQLDGITRTDRMRVFRAYEAALYGCHSASLERRVAAMIRRRIQRNRGSQPHLEPMAPAMLQR
jgi:hypothetical protein